MDSAAIARVRMEMQNTILSFWDGDKGTPVEDYSDEEAETLGRYVTNVDSNIYAWKIGDNLAPEQAGALLSRYSRTMFTGRKLFLKEFLPNRDRGREFFEAWLVDYGDDSIQEMAGGLPVSTEYVSNVMAKEIEDCRLGSYIEKSTRYVAFDKKLPNGDYMFYKDKDIMASRFGDDYLELMNDLFAAYSQSMEAMGKYISEQNPLEKQRFRIGDSSVLVSELSADMVDKYGVTDADLKKAYDNSVKANSLDLLRDFLPMATLTHIGMSLNSRSYENMINKLKALPSAEANHIATRMHGELRKLVPSLLRRVDEKYGVELQNHYSERRRNARGMVSKLLDGVQADRKAGATLVDYTGRGEASPDQRAQVILAATIMFEGSRGHSLSQLEDYAAKMPEQQRIELISNYVGARGNRRHKPGRAFENVEYRFDFMGRLGIFRDIQRHRIGTQVRQDFGVALGYNMRDEFARIGIDDKYEALMARVVDLYKKLYETMPYQAQYVVTLGFNTRWYYTFNARQFFHFGELRTGPGGHPDYRRLVQEAYQRIKEVHPSITQHMSYIDLNDKKLGRLDSEVRIARKKGELEKKATATAAAGAK